MPNVTPCPSSTDLQRYLLGQIPDASASAIDAHLEKCAGCVQSLGLLPSHDLLVEVVQASGRLRRPRNPFIDGLVQKLEGLSLTLLPNRLAAQRDIPSQAAPLGETVISATAPSDFDSGTRIQPPPDDPREYLSPAQAPDELGRLGGYRVVRILGQGGMGVVFLAEDVHLKRRIALKVMRPSIAASPEARRRFVQEAQATAALEHEHIVTIHQVHEDRGVPFLAMPFLQGETLEERLRRDTKLPVAEAVRIAREIAEGLAAAHDKGLIHRDIKPVNVWLTQEGRVKILDFGLARSLEGDMNLTQTGAIVGTPAYMSPEQARGDNVDGRSDLFSLGCVLYRILTGERPFKGFTPMAQLRSLEMDQPAPPNQVNPQVPASLSDVVMRLLAKNPVERLGSARQVVAALRAIENEHHTLLQEPAYPVAIPVQAPGDWSAVLKIPAHWKKRLLTWQMGAVAAGLFLALTGLSLAGFALLHGGKKATVPPANGPALPPIASLQVEQKKGFQAVVRPLDTTKTGKALTVGSLVTAPAEIKDVEAWSIDTDKYAAQPDGVRFLASGRALDLVAARHRLFSLEKLDLIPAPAGGEFVELSPDDQRWVTYGVGNQKITIGLTSEEREPRPILGFPNGVKMATWHPAGKMLAVVELDGKITICDGVAASKITDREWKLAFATNYSTVRWSPDGNTLAHFLTYPPGATGCNLLNPETGEVLKTIATTETPLDVKWSPDSTMLAIRTTGNVTLWRIDPAKQLAQFPAGNVAWRPDSKALAYANGNTAYLREVGQDKDTVSFAGHQNAISAVEFSPDGKTLITIAADKTIRFWEADTGKHRGTLLFLTTNRVLVLSSNGHYAGSSRVEDDFFFVYRQKGQNDTCSPEQFRDRFGWKNERDRVSLFAQ